MIYIQRFKTNMDMLEAGERDGYWLMQMAEDDFNVRYQYSDKVQAVGSRSDAVSHAVPNVSTEDIGISESPALKTRRFAEASEILRALNIVQRICSVFETKQPKMTRGWPVQYKCV